MIGPLTCDPAIEALVLGDLRGANEGAPEGGAGQRALGAQSSSSSSLGLLLYLLGEQALKRMLQMPLALMKLGVGPALLDRPQHPAVGVADDPLGLARQRSRGKRSS